MHLQCSGADGFVFSSPQLIFRQQWWSNGDSTAILLFNAVFEHFALFKISFHIHLCCHADSSYSFIHITTYSVAVSRGKADACFCYLKKLGVLNSPEESRVPVPTWAILALLSYLENFSFVLP